MRGTTLEKPTSGSFSVIIRRARGITGTNLLVE
jgi:hypothetical protein